MIDQNATAFFADLTVFVRTDHFVFGATSGRLRGLDKQNRRFIVS
jgi:hypothetical protein